MHRRRHEQNSARGLRLDFVRHAHCRIQQSRVRARAAGRRPAIALPTGTSPRRRGGRRRGSERDPLPELLAKADAKKGAQDAKICATCHSFEKGGAAKDRPGALGRRRPSGRLGRRLRLFRCRSRRVGGDWTYETLDHWIANPKGMAAGTKMAFAGEKDAQEARRHSGLSADAQSIRRSRSRSEGRPGRRAVAPAAGIGNRR